MRNFSIFLTLSLCLTAIIGDHIVFKSRYSGSLTYRAITDNLIHASIGFISAIIFFQHEAVTRASWLFNIVFCTVVSSLIDVDHFIMAKTIHIKDLPNSKQRGFLHCTSFWIVFTLIILLYSILCRKINIYNLSFMLTIAYSSHHIRDANRRGIWLYPLGSTPPVPKYLYVAMIAILPSALVYVYQYMKPLRKLAVANYNILV